MKQTMYIRNLMNLLFKHKKLMTNFYRTIYNLSSGAAIFCNSAYLANSRTATLEITSHVATLPLRENINSFRLNMKLGG